MNYTLEDWGSIRCFYNGMNSTATSPNYGDMTLNMDGEYVYTTNEMELQGGSHNYYITYEDEYGAVLSTDLGGLGVNGPNMCPELDEIILTPQSIGSNGMEAHAEYDAGFTNLNLRLQYFDIDEELPEISNAYIVGDPYTMEFVKSSNDHQVHCDWYDVEVLIPTVDPFFYFEFKDDTSSRSTLACTTIYPQEGVFYPLKLSEPKVYPHVGDPTERYTFSVRFFSPFDIPPDRAKVFINNDTIGKDMALITGTGSPGNGVYSYTTAEGELGAGLNTYSFLFSNDRDLDPNDIDEFSARAPMGSDTYHGPSISTWPLYRHDRMHSGKANISSSIIPSVPEFDYFDTGGPIPGSAVVDWDGKIYFGSRDKNFYCLDSDLNLLWSFETGYWIDSSATLGPDGTVIFPSRDNNIYCLNAVGENMTGEERFLWKYSAEGVSSSSPVVAPNGNIIVGSSYGILYALNSDGTLNWAYEIGKGAIDGSPVVSTNGTIFFGATDTYFYALRSDGSLYWKFKTGDVIRSTPLLLENGGLVESIIFTSNDRKVYCIANDGNETTPPTLKWTYVTGAKFMTSSPALGASNNIYVASDKVYSLNVTSGSLQWSYEDIENVVLSSPVTDYDDHIVFGGQDGRIYVLNDDNSRHWSYLKESGPWSSSPIILGNGEIVVGSWDGKLYKISERAVNTSPILSNNKVTPVMGNNATTFVYSVEYFDADNDPPEQAYLYIDDKLPVTMNVKSGEPFDGTYYFEITGLDMGDNHKYHFVFTDGNWDTAASVRFPASTSERFDGPIVNDLPSLSCDTVDVACVTPDRGNSETLFTFSVAYVDPDGGENPGPTAMIYFDDDVGNFQYMLLESGTIHDGVYSYQITGEDLGSGVHTFYYLFTDFLGYGVRYPLSGSIFGPTVNESPVLSNGSVSPAQGDTNTMFIYEVHYSDPDNDPVKTAKVYIDGESYDMAQSSSSLDSSVYTFETSLKEGKHNYYFVFTDINDSVGRFPAASNQTLEGPFVVQAPVLSNATLEPEIGNESTEFVFTVDYLDEGNLPPKMQTVHVNNKPFPMVLIAGENYNGTYQAVIKGFNIGVGYDNSYYFLFQNTIDAITRYPATDSFNGPTVLSAAINIPFWQVRPHMDTLFTLNNIGTTTAQARVTLNSKDGVLMLDDYYQIPPRGQRTISVALETDVFKDYGYGEITWTSGSLIAWGVVYNSLTGGSAFPIHFDIPRESPIYIPYYSIDVYKNLETGIFLTNLSNVIATGTISCYSSFGQLFAREIIEVEPGLMDTILVSQLEGMPGGVEGYAKVEWDQGVLNIFEAVFDTVNGGGFAVHCYPPFESRVEIPNW
jgi:outer membrane protein assembly factor BamB